MKRFILLALIMAITTGISFATKHTITNSGFTFSPSTLTINVGDTVIFTLASAHNALEVSKATYDANGNTSNGGFTVPFGGGTVIFKNAGIFYFVCEPHASLGMKGIITVSTPAGINTLSTGNTFVEVYPNPASDYMTISYSLDSKANVTIKLIDAEGRNVSGIVSEARTPGTWEETYAINNLVKPGLYFLTIQYGSQLFVKKVIIK